MSRFFGWLGLASALLAPACRGKYVTISKPVTLGTTLNIREGGQFTKFAAINFADLAKAKSDIPNNAEIKSLVITALGISYTVLPTTDAATMQVGLLIKNAAGQTTVISKTKTVGGLLTNVKNSLILAAAVGIQNDVNKLRDQLNAFLRSNANITFQIGIAGIPESGRLDIDMVANVILTVTYKSCESIPGTLLSLTGSECTPNPLESSGNW